MAESLNLLAARAKSGDDAARDDLVAQVRFAVLRYALGRGESREDADDLAQDVCLAVVSRLEDWEETGRSMWGYVFTIARHRLVDAARHRTRRARLVDDTGAVDADQRDESPGPEDQAVARDGLARLQRLLDTLPANQRDVIVLRAVVGLSTKETAHALGLAPGSIHVLAHRATRTLRTLLAADDDARMAR